MEGRTVLKMTERSKEAQTVPIECFLDKFQKQSTEQA
jgi:hypothetical protein